MKSHTAPGTKRLLRYLHNFEWPVILEELKKIAEDPVRAACFAPGGIATARRKVRRCARGSTAWLRTPASKVCLWCGSQHRPKHFNEGTYTVVTDCDRDLRDRFSLCQHLKGGKQPRLLSPTAK